jgi:hypothetical protein
LIKTAIDWWLAHRNNWPENPYDFCEVYSAPTGFLVDEYAPREIGNWLRARYLVGLSIETLMVGPCDGGIDDPIGGTVNNGGFPPPPPVCSSLVNHAITAWGDEMGDEELTDNPTLVQVTDSDRDDEEEYDQDGNINLQQYDWIEDFTPGQWRLDYFGTHLSTLKSITVLKPLDKVVDAEDTQLVVGSYRIHQGYEKYAATDLHYTVGTDTDICSYRTVIDWPRPNNPSPPEILEEQYPPRNLFVEWDLRQDRVPLYEWVTITTEFVLSRWNSIRYTNVHWTYPATGTWRLPGFQWRISTPQRVDPNSLVVNATGGYVIGSFDLIEIASNQGEIQNPRLVGQYRFQHEYLHDQEQEYHEFELKALEVPFPGRVYFVTNLRLGHSYGRLQDESLWTFNRWMTEVPTMYPFTPHEPVRLQIDWKGRLPYPQAVRFMPTCMEYIPGDLNQDCVVDWKDFAIMADYWLADSNTVFHWKTPK